MMGTYDNPATGRREGYRDGRVVCFIDARLVQEYPDDFGFIAGKKFPWRSGRIYGEASAMCDPIEVYPVQR